MKAGKWITVAAVVTLSSTLALAGQHGGGKHGRGGRHGMAGEHFAQKLNLTEAQRTQVREINQTFREENKAFFEQMRQTRTDFRSAKESGDQAQVEALKGTLESQRAQMKQLREAHMQRLMTTLTPEQRQQWETLKAERQARHGQRGDHGKNKQK